MYVAVLVSCRIPGCPGFLRVDGACDRGHGNRRTLLDARRPSARARGYDSRWEKASKAYLASHPLCASCERANRVTAATLTDHVIPHGGDRTLFWASSNWQSLCDECHALKTARESGIARCGHAAQEVGHRRGVLCLDCGRVLSGRVLSASRTMPGGSNSSGIAAQGPREGIRTRSDRNGDFKDRAG